MGTHAVVVLPPCGEHGASFIERWEQRFVEALIAKPTNEALGKTVLLRLARLDVVTVDIAVFLPLEGRHAGEFGAVIGTA